MANFFKELIKTDPHSLEYIRKTLDFATDEECDFIPLLKDHHDFLQESISILLDRDAKDIDKQRNLVRFFRLLDMHARAEEETLYVRLRLNEEKEARLEGYAGQNEHDVAFQLEEELLMMGYLDTWNEEIAAKAKVLAALVSNHIKEEEAMMFPIVLRELTKAEIRELRWNYLQKCKAYLSDDDGSLTEEVTRDMLPPVGEISPEHRRI